MNCVYGVSGDTGRIHAMESGNTGTMQIKNATLYNSMSVVFFSIHIFLFDTYGFVSKIRMYNKGLSY